MNRMKRAIAFLLAFCIVLPLCACGDPDENKTGDPDYFETKQLSATEQAEADEAALKDFVAKYRAGEYDEKKLFRYEDLSVYFQLAEYKGVEYPNDRELDETVTDQEITDYLTGIQVVGIIPDEDYTEITEGVIQKFDVLTLDYTGYVNGEKQDNATAQDQELLIGSGDYIPGFEEGLIGKEVGKEIVLNLKFSPYYSSKEMAGKDIEFHVTVKKARRPKIPELKVEDINKLYASSFKTMDEVREDIRSYLKSTKENKAYSYAANYIQLKILEQSKVLSYPEKEMEYYTRHYLDYYTQNVGEEQPLEEYCQENLGCSYEQLQADAKDYAQETVAGTMMIRLVAEKEKIQCTDEQLETIIVGLYANVSNYYTTMESFLVDYIDLYGADYFEQQVVSAAVSQFLLENGVKVG